MVDGKGIAGKNMCYLSCCAPCLAVDRQISTAHPAFVSETGWVMLQGKKRGCVGKGLAYVNHGDIGIWIVV